MFCHIDIESFSEVNLKTAGLYRYADHPSTELTSISYKFGHDGPTHQWCPYESIPKLARPLKSKMDKGGQLYVQTECPEDLAMWIIEGRQLRAWNAQFERKMLNGEPGQRLGVPETPHEQWMCTMAKGMAVSIPPALGNAAACCGTRLKNEAGRNDMLALAKPRKPSKNNPNTRFLIEDEPEKYRSLFHYNMDDVRAEAELDEYLPEMSPGEMRAYRLDQLINDRGVRADLPSVANVQVLIKEYKDTLAEKCVEWTGVRPSQTAALAEWVRKQGYDIENLQKATVLEARKDPNCPDKVKRVLRLYSTHNMKAVSKYAAIERSVSSDGRLHGMFLYHGASTGRWSSRIVQLQNLFRPVIDDAEEAIRAFTLRSLDWVRTLWTKNPMQVFASCVRGMLIPAEGHDFMCLDYTSIEALVTAWLAGQDEILQTFENGRDLYVHAASGIYRISYEEVTSEQRFIGKIAVLALGYQGGRKAFAKMAKQYGVEIDEQFAEEIKKDWRAANPKIVKLWYKMEEAAIAAVAHPGKVYEVSDKKIMFKVDGDWLYMRLPSGRRLAYYKPRLDSAGKLTYFGLDTYTRQWKRCSTYGGKLTENAVQAIARDLLLHGMFQLEEAGYPIVGTVHDEVIMEILEAFGSMEEASKLLCNLPEWAAGLPVKASGFRAKRYRKE